jgi:hypothetical protein
VRPLDVAQGDGEAGGDVPDVLAALLARSTGSLAEREDAVGRRALVVDAFGPRGELERVMGQLARRGGVGARSRVPYWMASASALPHLYEGEERGRPQKGRVGLLALQRESSPADPKLAGSDATPDWQLPESSRHVVPRFCDCLLKRQPCAGAVLGPVS